MKEYIDKSKIEYPYMTMTLWGLNQATCHAYNEGVKATSDAIATMPAADVVSKAAFDQVMWERDVAIQQLREDYGVGLGEKKAADVVERKDLARVQVAYDKVGQALDAADRFYTQGYNDAMADHDVVKVVRCKDCKHQGDPMACPMCQEGFHYDEDDGGDYFTVDLTTDDGFCDRGEIKEDIK